MYYSEWTCTYGNGTTVIGFIVHEYLLTYDSDIGDCRGFFRVIRSGKINKKVRPKTRILRIHGGGYFGSLYTDSNYKLFIRFISLNKKFTQDEETQVRMGFKINKILCIGKP